MHDSALVDLLAYLCDADMYTIVESLQIFGEPLRKTILVADCIDIYLRSIKEELTAAYIYT